MKGAIFILLASLCAQALGEGSAEHRLIDELRDEYPAHDQRPLHDASDVLNMSISYSFTNLLNFDEDNNVATIYGWMIESWTDEYMVWDAEEWGVDRLNIDRDSIWRPDVRSYQATEEVMVDNTMAVVRPNGYVVHVPPIRHSVQCEDMGEMMADMVHCELVLGPWSYHTGQIFMTASSSSDNGVRTDFMTDHPHYNVTNVHAALEERTFECCPEPYQSLKVEFCITKIH